MRRRRSSNDAWSVCLAVDVRGSIQAFAKEQGAAVLNPLPVGREKSLCDISGAQVIKPQLTLACPSFQRHSSVQRWLRLLLLQDRIFPPRPRRRPSLLHPLKLLQRMGSWTTWSRCSADSERSVTDSYMNTHFSPAEQNPSALSTSFTCLPQKRANEIQSDTELNQWKRGRWYALRDTGPCQCRYPVTTSAAIFFVVLCSYAFDGVGQSATWIFNHERPPFPLDSSTTTFRNLTNFTATVKATHERLNTPPQHHHKQGIARDPHRQGMDNLAIAYAVRDYAMAWMVAQFGATGLRKSLAWAIAFCGFRALVWDTFKVYARRRWGMELIDLRFWGG
ncbi:hypothetical protein BJX65DRAFT_45505 [Aspergillus insuetus]